MNNPPVPIKPGDWATLLALLTWIRVKPDPLGTDIGHFRDGSSVVHRLAAVDVSGATTWMLSTTAPSAGVVEALMTSATANILKTGTTNADGTVTLSGTTYKIELYWDGVNVTARAV